MRASLFLLPVLAWIAAPTASAQDVDILATAIDGQIRVSEFNRDLNAQLPTRAFAGRFDGNYVDNNPGFASLAGSGSLPGGAALEWDFLPMTHNGLTSTLLYWDAQGSEPNFIATPTPDYELTLFGRDNAAAVADGGDQLVPGEIIDFASSSGAIHAHQFFFLDDNGDGTNATTPADGYYLIAMRLRVAGFERSDPFYLAWGTPGTTAQSQQQVVMPWLEQQIDTLVLPGDHNFDGVVDAADYTVWRDGSGVTHSAIDLSQWRQNYGASAEATAAAQAVPEPTSLGLLIGLSSFVFGGRRR